MGQSIVKQLVGMVFMIYLFTACDNTVWPPEDFEPLPTPALSTSLGEFPIITTGNAEKLVETSQLGIGAPRKLVYAPNNRTLIGFGRSGIYVYGSNTDVPRYLNEHTDVVMDVTFSLDGDRMFSSSSDGTIRLWNPGNWSLVDTWQLEGGVDGIAAHPDGKRILSVRIVRQPSRIIVESRDIETGELLEEIATVAIRKFSVSNNPVAEITDVAIDPDGQYIAFSHLETYVVEIETGKRISTVDLDFDEIGFVPGHPGELLGVDEGNEGFYIFDVTKPDEVYRPSDYSIFDRNYSTSFAIHPDGIVALVGLHSGRIFTVRPPNLSSTWRYNFYEPEHYGFRILDVVYSPDGERIATVSEEGVVREWDLDLRLLREFSASDFEVRAIAWNPDGSQLKVFSLTSQIRTYDTQSNEEISSISTETQMRRWVRISDDGRKYIEQGDRTDGLQIRDLQTGGIISEIDTDRRLRNGDAFTPDGDYFVEIRPSRQGGEVKIWDVNTGQLHLSLALNELSDAQSLAFSPGGEFMLVGLNDAKGFMIWDWSELITGEAQNPTVRIRDGVENEFQADVIAVSANYTLVAVDDDELFDDKSAEIGLWNILTREKLHTIPLILEPTDYLIVAFNPTGSLLAIGGEQGDVMLIDVEMGKVLLTFQAHSGLVQALEFSPDGTTLATGGRDGVVRLWRVTS